MRARSSERSAAKSDAGVTRGTDAGVSAETRHERTGEPMSLKRILVRALGAVALTADGSDDCGSPPPSTSASATPPQIAPASVRSAHASLQLNIGHAKAWVGQALPCTLKAYFRGAEGMTMGLRSSILRHLHLRAGAGTAPGDRDDWRGAGARGHLDGNGDALFPGAAPDGRRAARARSLSRGGTSGAMPAMPDLVPRRPLRGPRWQSLRQPFFQRFMEQSNGRVREESVSLRASAHTD